MARQVDADDNYKCSTCNEDAANTFMICSKCKSKIHVLDCADNNDLCTKTCLDGWATWLRKYQCIQFTCPDCLLIINNDHNVSEKVAEMEGKIVTLTQEFVQLKQTLQKDAPTTPDTPTNVVEQVRTEETPAVPATPAAAVTPNAAVTPAASVNEAATLDGFQQLSEHDTTRAKKLLRFLKNSDLRRVKTVFIMDSNGNGIKANHLDPDGGCKVIASGGLCMVAAVHALHEYTGTHNNVKKVVHIIGTNDELHREQHKPSERVNYVKALHNESMRIFPNAHINIVLPFGGTKIDYKHIESLSKDITDADVAIRQYRGPNMRHKLRRDNLHMSPEGQSLFKDFLTSRFIPKKAHKFSVTSGRINNPASNTNGETNIDFTPHYYPDQNRANRAEPNSSGRGASSPGVAGTKWSSVVQNPPSEQASFAAEVAESIAKIMATHRDRSGPIPPGPYYRSSHQPYGWPQPPY